MKAQITLEHTFDSTGIPFVYWTNIDTNESKYVVLNKQKNCFSLYNMDMSPFLVNVQIPVVSDSIVQGFGVIYITRRLFDCDPSNIEYVYQTPYDIKHKFRVFRTDGTLLFELDSANGPYSFGGMLGGSIDFRPIANTSDGAKLFLQKYDSNQQPQLLVYSLCGKLPLNVFDFSEQKQYVKIFPNPTEQELSFEVLLPNNQDHFELVVFDMNAKEQGRKNLYLQNGKCTLDVKNYSAGAYLYSLISNGNVFQSGKFIIKK